MLSQILSSFKDRDFAAFMSGLVLCLITLILKQFPVCLFGICHAATCIRCFLSFLCAPLRRVYLHLVCLMPCTVTIPMSFLWTLFHLARSVVFGYSKWIVIFQVCPHKCWGNNHLPHLAGTFLLMQPRRWLVHCQLHKTNC